MNLAALLRAMMVAQVATAVRATRKPTSPAALAKRLYGDDWTVTPTLALISDALVDAIDSPNRRYIISCPPRTGKSVLVSQVGTVFALMRDPDSQLILKSYSDALAEEHSLESRRRIGENADLLGFTLDPDKTSSARWKVNGRKGGLLAGGIFTSTTGFGAHLLLVDDPVKGAQDADSPSTRRRLMAEFRSSLLTRRMPGASVVVVMTRWHEQDLAAELLAEGDGYGEGGWVHINVPAVSTPGVVDALHRPPGVPMTTALGVVDFDQIRREVGTRTWTAMYLGTPTAPEGGLFKTEWLASHRCSIAPGHPLRTVVAVDPADSGERDQAGIVAASLTADGRVHLIADESGKMTSEQWAQRAIALALDVGASEIHVEAFASGTTYIRIVKEALARTAGASHIRVSGWPPKGKPRKGDDVARAAGLMQAAETDRFIVAGNLPEWEKAATGWQAGQHCPDRVAAAVIAFDVLAPVAGNGVVFADPLAARDRDAPPPEWMTRRVTGDGPDRSLIGAAIATSSGSTPREQDATRRMLARSTRGGGYDPLAAPRRTIRGL